MWLNQLTVELKYKLKNFTFHWNKNKIKTKIKAEVFLKTIFKRNRNHFVKKYHVECLKKKNIKVVIDVKWWQSSKNIKV